MLKSPQSRKLTPPNANEDVKQQELSFLASANAKWYKVTLKVSFFTKLSILFLYGRAIVLLGILQMT